MKNNNVFGNQFLFLIKELSDDTLPIFEPVETCDFNDLSTTFPPLPEIFMDSALNFLAANLLYDNYLLSKMRTT